MTNNNTDAKKAAAGVPADRRQERRSRILEAATRLFLRDGYDQTSVDMIVDLSGGSKATLYSYFPTKAELFRAVVEAVTKDSPEPELDFSKDTREELIKFATERLRIALSPRHRDLLRLVIAERERFPDLAQMFYEQGAKPQRAAVAAYMAAMQCERGHPVEAPEELADFFMGMLLHRWYKKLLLLGAEPPNERTIRLHVERVVDRFIQAFRLGSRPFAELPLIDSPRQE